MEFKQMSESPLLYGLAGIAIILVTLVTLYFLVTGYKHALTRGVSKEKLHAVIKSSVTFSIVPSIAVMAGLVTLVAVIGIPYAWLRLSVLGSVAYELMASNMALSALNLDLATADGYAFGLVMWTMCVGITLPLLLNVFMVRKIHLGSLKLGDRDVKWGQISQTTFMSALLIALVVPMFVKGMVEFLTFLASGGIAIIIAFIVKKTGWGWLGGFTLAISMIGAMVAAVGLDKLFN